MISCDIAELQCIRGGDSVLEPTSLPCVTINWLGTPIKPIQLSQITHNEGVCSPDITRVTPHTKHSLFRALNAHLSSCYLGAHEMMLELGRALMSHMGNVYDVNCNSLIIRGYHLK
jgi:hypothetical protein